MRRKKPSRIKEAVLETAHDLHRIGLMDDMTMRDFHALCRTPVKAYSAREIKRIRRSQKASQSTFAAFLNVTKSTVAQWEQGERKPRGSSLKLLELVERKGLDVLA